MGGWNYMAALGLLLVMVPGTVAAELIFSAPPRESAEDGEALYAPIAERMSELLDREVEYVHPDGWLEYSNAIRDDEYDIVFDGPHFAAWRIREHGHRPVARLAGELKFYVVIDRDNDDISDLDDLVGKRVCGPASPNLGTLTFLSQYDNPLQQPAVYSPSGGFVRMFKGLEDGECDAAVMRTLAFHNALEPNQQGTARIIYESDSMPNQGFTASSELSQVERDQLRHGITGEPAPGDPLAALVDRFGGGEASRFIESTAEEHEGVDNVLRGVIRGW